MAPNSADQKWAAEERKLSQAYDDVSYGRYKVAQNALDRHLKKSPKSQPALVLRMVLLERTGADDEDILKAFEGVKATGELSSRGSWYVSSTLRAIQRLDLVLDLGVAAWEVQPDRVELGESTFLHAVAAWNTPVMCSSSRKMFNKLRSPTWGRVAAWAEYVSKTPVPADSSSTTQAAPAKDYQVAKLLLSTAGKDCHTHTSDVYWLRMKILLAAGDAAGALKVAQEHGKVGSLNRLWYRMTMVPEILEKIEDGKAEGWEVEWQWVVEKVRGDWECQRNYAFYQYMMKVAKHLGSEKAKEAVQVLQSVDEAIGTKERAPKLALLQLDNEVDAETKLSKDEWDAMIEAYWHRWGLKESIITELEGVAAGYEDKKSGMMKLVEGKRQIFHTDVKSYRETLHAEQIVLRTKPADWIAAASDVERLWNLYLTALPYGANVPDTDVQPADHAAYLTVHLLALQWAANKPDQTRLLRALLCLRYMLRKSPSAAHARHIIARIARLIGAPGLITAQHFGETGIQEVQLDTLLHVIVERGAIEAHVKGSPEHWVGELDKAERVYKRTATDLPEQVRHAIQGETYTKVPSIYTFNQTFAKSISGASTRIEKARYQLLSGQIPTGRQIKRLRADWVEAKAGNLRETRDWGMFISIGGGLPALHKVLALEREVDGSWIRCWGELVLGLVSFLKGETIAVEDGDDVGLSAAEKVVIAGWRQILRRLDQLTSAKGATEESTPLSDLFSDLTILATNPASSESSTFARLYPALLLIEVNKMLDLVVKHLDSTAQPTGPSKSKKKADPRVGALTTEIKDLRKDLREKAKIVAEALTSLEGVDRAIDWQDIARGFVEDAEFVTTLGQEVTEAKSGFVKSIQAALKGGKS